MPIMRECQLTHVGVDSIQFETSETVSTNLQALIGYVNGGQLTVRIFTSNHLRQIPGAATQFEDRE